MQGQPLRLYNSYTRRVEDFSPIDPAGPVRMYSCGPTVYSRQHIGNLLAYLFVDTLKRTLRWKGFEVDHVINITDVGHLLADADFGDDKVEEAAKAESKTVWDLTEHYTTLFFNDLEKLRVIAPRLWTKATEYIEPMIHFAQRLEAQGHTYRLPSGLYFDTTTIDNYGVLANIDHTRLREGARVGQLQGRRHPTDFALWRTYDPTEPPRAMQWESPWGIGAPGWHLECSVMSIQNLGPHFDIHTGGIDHQEVHHPNEDAQSTAYLADGQQWVKYWLHNEFLNFGSEKMAKSKGNVLALDEVTGNDGNGHDVPVLAFRALVLAAHYRSQTRALAADVAAAGRRLERLAEAAATRLGDEDESGELESTLINFDQASAALAAQHQGAGFGYLTQIDKALSDDLATPRAWAIFGEAIGDSAVTNNELRVLLSVANSVFGINLLQVAREHKRAADVAAAQSEMQFDTAARETIEFLIAERQTARNAGEYSAADAFRKRLHDKFAVVLTDNPDGTTWTVERQER